MGNSGVKEKPPTPLPTPVRQPSPPPRPTPPPRQYSSTSFQSRTPSIPSPTATTYIPAPVVVEPGNQTVKHGANNYVFSEAPKLVREEDHFIPAPQKVPDKFGLRVCPQYNSNPGCKAALCKRLHICHFWALKVCRNTNCKYDHSFSSLHNSYILQVFACGGHLPDNIVIAALQDNHKRTKKTRDSDDSICMHNIMKRCSKNPCPFVHSNKSYMWEVHDGNEWLQLSFKQSDYLEEAYQHPSQDHIELPPLQPFPRQPRNLKILEQLLSLDRSWNLDLETMILTSGKISLSVRRLSTPSDMASDLHLTTRWLWYWQDDDSSWHQYGSGNQQQLFVLSLSDQFEYYLQCGQNSHQYETGGHSYIINFGKMIQTNILTRKERRVCRRPAGIIKEDKGRKFDELFKTLPQNKKFMLFPVLPNTMEFKFIEKMMKSSLGSLNIASLQRVQNDHLWRVYQNKKRLLLALYNGNVSSVNEQYLFHGTKHSVIDQICSDNLDWRLYGSNVGHIYGRGVYFTNMASTSDSYSERQSNLKAVFVVYVLVGSMTVGNREMDIPPENPKTGKCFDTTCNAREGSTIFVKYNRDEYYPAYIVKYRC